MYCSISKWSCPISLFDLSSKAIGSFLKDWKEQSSPMEGGGGANAWKEHPPMVCEGEANNAFAAVSSVEADIVNISGLYAECSLAFPLSRSRREER